VRTYRSLNSVGICLRLIVKVRLNYGLVRVKIGVRRKTVHRSKLTFTLFTKGALGSRLRAHGAAVRVLVLTHATMYKDFSDEFAQELGKVTH